MAAKPLKAPAIDWEEFDRLLLPEKLGPEWCSTQDLIERYKFKKGKEGLGGSVFKKLKRLFETKKIRCSDGKYRNYYRIKK